VGAEATCRARIDGIVRRGRVLLETSEIIFRSDEGRVLIPFASIQSVQANDGELLHRGGEAAFELGALAARWVEKLRTPKTLLDKLGVKPGTRAVVLGVRDDAFLESMHSRCDAVARRMRSGAGLVFLGVQRVEDLERLNALRTSIAPDGAVWVIRPKGAGAIVSESQVRRAGLEAGFVDVKVVAFSPTHTAEKFVIRVSERRGTGRAPNTRPIVTAQPHRP
jgi:hypothetical protein